MSKSIEEILAPKPVARLRIYAYSIDDRGHEGLFSAGSCMAERGTVHPMGERDE